MPTASQSGQTTVEFALLLPLALLLVAAVVEIGLLVADNNRVASAAREAARVAAVTSDLDEIESAAELSGLNELVVEVSPRAELRTQGGTVEVKVTYEPEGRLPLAGQLVRVTTLSARAAMRIERP